MGSIVFWLLVCGIAIEEWLSATRAFVASRPNIRKGAGVVLAISAFFSVVAWLLSKQWQNERLFGFAATLFPLIVSIALAFIPDHKMSGVTRVAWRSVVILAGIMYSVVLWHQQSLSLENASRQQAKLLEDATRKSNEHSDAQVGAVRDDVKAVSKHSDEQIGNVRSDLKELATTFTRGAEEVSKHIEKAVPQPPAIAKLIFSFATTETNKVPVLITHTTLQDDPPRIAQFVRIAFTFGNISEVTAVRPEVWITICEGCAYVRDPEGFQRMKGAIEQTRYRHFPGSITPETFFPDITLDITPPLAANSFEVALRYACENCGRVTKWQTLTVFVDR